MKRKPGEPCPHDFLFLDKERHSNGWAEPGHFDEVCVECLARSCEVKFVVLEEQTNGKKS